jgi:CheY-like chemotaxis protein
VEEQLKTRFAGARILLAEDEPINQEVSRCLLEDVGLSIDLAEDGKQAVALAREHRYDLILMDLQMPQLNGIDATRAIRALPGCADIPILAMTANAFDEDRQVCLEAGMDDHIGKPVVPELLFATLLKWLAKSGGARVA